MSHDKIRAATRRRMARTGEPYAAARRAVIMDHEATGGGVPPAGTQPGGQPLPGTQWFAISYSRAGIDKITAWLDTLLGSGPGSSGVTVDADQLQIRMGEYRLRIPRASVRSARRSQAKLRGTTGVHAERGRLLINGSADGLVELTIDPPGRTGRTLNTMFVNQRVHVLILSLVDPDGFIAALELDARG
jgi:hypothetical protein